MRGEALSAKHPRRGWAVRATALWESRGSRAWWPAAKRTLVVLFFLGVMGLLANQARSVDWPAVLVSLKAYPMATLMTAGGVAASSYLSYCGYDLLARYYTRHTLPVPQVMCVGFIAYAFNLSLGAWVGAIALRYRLYTRLGLTTDVVTRVFAFSLLTNWLGYILLGGVVFLWAPLELPPGWSLGTAGLRVTGAALLLLGAAYLLLCCVSTRRTVRLRGHEVAVPSGGVSLLQALFSCVNWMLAACVLYVLMQGKVAYADVLAVWLLAAIAGVVARVPAGLGVLEAVFATLLSQQIAQGALLAALLAYRAIYNLLPLLLAAVLLLVVDAHASAGGSAAQA